MKQVYLFDEYENQKLKDFFGKKGTYILDTINLGLPVRNGFIITADVCNQFYKDDNRINYDVLRQVIENISKLEQLTGKKFGSMDNPLLFSIKCSPKNDMPDIMKSILNVGLTYDIVENLSKISNEYIWIWECYLDFIRSYSKIIMKIDLDSYAVFEDALKNSNSKLTIEQLRMFANKLKDEYRLKTQNEFPDNSIEQLYLIINAAFYSWSNKKAEFYRKDLGIPFEEGMALCMQPMVFGNINQKSGTGTIFTRDPITGEIKDKFTDKKYFVGSFSKQSLGNKLNMDYDVINEDSILATEFPEIYKQLKIISRRLEKHYEDMIKIDFVIENNKLFITQICKGKRTAKAGLKIQCDIFNEYILNKKDESLEDKEIKVSFDLVFGGFKQREIEPLYKAERKENPALKKLRKKDYKK